ncbi:MAG: hypothetical protein OEM52_14120, partial [bacterium]|nr:hypothetical protein [bacterium]
MAIDWERLTEEMKAEVARLEFEWIDFHHTASTKHPNLKLFIDRRNAPLTIDDATFLTRILVNWLQTKLPETVDFRLDISSPGLDRPFHQPWQFTKHIGATVQITTRNEQRITIGILTASEEVGATIEPVDGEPVTIPWENIGEGKVVLAE